MTIRPAASLIVCVQTKAPLNKPDFKVLMIKRNNKGLFKNLHVYPGGVQDKQDQSFSSSSKTNLKTTAIRETFEECGLALFHPTPDLSVSEWKTWRNQGFGDFCTRFSTRPNLDSLVHWAHWITPEIEKKRFDTHFFLTTVNETDLSKQEISADGSETVALTWSRPDEILHHFRQQADDGSIKLFPPQYCTLTDLCEFRFKDLENFVNGTTKRDPVVAFLPEKVLLDDGDTFMALPGDQFHSSTLGLDGGVHRVRFIEKDGGRLDLDYQSSSKSTNFKSKI